MTTHIPARDDAGHDDPTVDSPRSAKTTADLQSTSIDESPAVEADTDADDVKVLPGTGGPDDEGEIEVDPSELNLSGDSIPGHPKPGSDDEA